MPTSTQQSVSFRINPVNQAPLAPEKPLPSPPAKTTPSKERVDWNDEMINSLLSFYEENKTTCQSSTVSTFFTELSERLGIPGNRISEKFIRLKHQYRVTAENLNKKGGMNPDSTLYKRMDKLFSSLKASPSASTNSIVSIKEDSNFALVPVSTSTTTANTTNAPTSSNGGFGTKIVFSTSNMKVSAPPALSKPVSSSNDNAVLTPTPLPPAPKPSFTELGQFTHTFASKEILCPPIQSAPQSAPTETSMLHSFPTPLMAPTTAINASTSAPPQNIPILPALPLPPLQKAEALNISPMPILPSSPDEMSLQREEMIIQKLKHDHELALRKQEHDHAIQMRQLDLAERELAYRESKLALRRERLQHRWASPVFEPASSRNDGSQI